MMFDHVMFGFLTPQVFNGSDVVMLPPSRYAVKMKQDFSPTGFCALICCQGTTRVLGRKETAADEGL
jgi:hypothetical protein